MAEESVVVSAIVTLLPLVLIPVLVLDAWRLIKPQRRIFQGRYADARAAAGRIERSWMRWVPGVRHAYRYTTALAFHLEGNLDASLALTRALGDEKLDANLRYAVLSLEAGTLVLAGQDAPRAIAAIEEARRVRETREDMLIMALALLAAGRAEDARVAFDRAEALEESSRVRIGRTILFSAPRLRRTIEAALRAMYLVRTGRAEEARADLEIAVSSPHANVYVARARDLIAPGVPTADEIPPSLSPHVLD